MIYKVTFSRIPSYNVLFLPFNKKIIHNNSFTTHFTIFRLFSILYKRIIVQNAF